MTDAARMHDVTAETRRIVDLVLDYSRERLLAQDTPLDKPLSAAELSRLAGRTISEDGVGAERALGVFTHVLAPACITTDDPRYLSFIPNAPTVAAMATARNRAVIVRWRPVLAFIVAVIDLFRV